MPNPVQFDIAVGALPDNLDTDPQGLLQAFAERLFISPSVPWSSFTLGAAQPTSDLGPWFKNGQELWVWSDVLATYIPLQLSGESLKYSVGTTAPDPTKYLFWIDTNSPQALKIYVAGNWIDVYAAKFGSYSTTTQMNAAIAAAVASIPAANSYPAQATHLAVQNIPVSNSYIQVVLDAAQINPAPAPFVPASGRYVAPESGIYMFTAIAQIDDVDSTPASLEINMSVFKNGVIELGSSASPTNLSGSRWHANFSGFVPLNATEYIDLRIIADDGVNTGNVEIGNVDFTVHKV